TAEAGDEVGGADEAAVEVGRDRDTARRTRSGTVAGIGLPEVVRERVGAAEVEGVVEITSADGQRHVILFPGTAESPLDDLVSVLVGNVNGHVRPNNPRIDPAGRVTLCAVAVQDRDRVAAVSVDRDAERRPDRETVADVGA